MKDVERNKDLMKGFLTAAGLLPQRLWRGAFSLSEGDRADCEEIRVRLDRPACALVHGRSRVLYNGDEEIRTTQDELDALIAKVTGSSVHTYNAQIAKGFVTAAGGHRLGLCGELVEENGKITTMRAFSSLNLRIAKEVPGIGDELIDKLYGHGPAGTLILSPPGGGKTTLLRDMARGLSARFRVAVADERYEIAAGKRGVPQFDLGDCDVLSGGGKAQAVEVLIRGMSPQVIAVDEITREEDAAAIIRAGHAGCAFLATAHAASPDDLLRRPIYRTLMAENVFSNIILIENSDGRRRYHIVKEDGIDAQADRTGDDRRLLLGHRPFHEQRAQ